MRLHIKLFIIATLLIQSLWAHASPINLLTNGSFESLQFGGDSTYRTNRNDVSGWTWHDGSAMEFWNTPYRGVTAVDGTKIAALNAYGGNGDYSFYQDFETVSGQQYQYSFSYQAESDNDEQFYVGITGFFDDPVQPQNLLQSTYSDHVTGQWRLAQGSFIALGSLSQIGFWSDDLPGDTSGNLLDNVVVTTAVPEPGTLGLVTLGLLCLGLSHRKNA
jgi:hypothetical protein